MKVLVLLTALMANAASLPTPDKVEYLVGDYKIDDGRYRSLEFEPKDRPYIVVVPVSQPPSESAYHHSRPAYHHEEPLPSYLHSTYRPEYVYKPTYSNEPVYVVKRPEYKPSYHHRDHIYEANYKPVYHPLGHTAPLPHTPVHREIPFIKHVSHKPVDAYEPKYNPDYKIQGYKVSEPKTKSPLDYNLSAKSEETIYEVPKETVVAKELEYKTEPVTEYIIKETSYTTESYKAADAEYKSTHETSYVKENSYQVPKETAKEPASYKVEPDYKPAVVEEKTYETPKDTYVIKEPVHTTASYKVEPEYKPTPSYADEKTVYAAKEPVQKTESYKVELEYKPTPVQEKTYETPKETKYDVTTPKESYDAKEIVFIGCKAAPEYKS